MVLPPLMGQGLQLAEFSKISRRFLMDSEKRQLQQQFDKLYQVSGIAHWSTPTSASDQAHNYSRILHSVPDDHIPFKDGAARAFIQSHYEMNDFVEFFEAL